MLAVVMLMVALISCFSFTPVSHAEEESELINSAEKFSDIEMNKLSELKDETCVDKMLSLNENVRKEILSKIVSNIAKGKAYDLNLISKLNNELNININEMAEDYKVTYVDSGIDK